MELFILTVFCILIGIGVSKEGKRGFSIVEYIQGLLGLVVMHVWIVALNTELPIALLYGPLVYAYYRCTTKPDGITYHMKWGHLLPFFVFSLFYLMVLEAESQHTDWDGRLRFWYHVCHFGLMICSLTGYSAWITVRKRKSRCLYDWDENLLIQLTTANVAYAIFNAILAMKILNIYDEEEFNPYVLIYGLLLFMTLLLVTYIVHRRYYKEMLQAEGLHLGMREDDNRYTKSYLGEELFKTYDKKVSQYLASSRIYLQASISLDELSRTLGIAKHHFSQYLNVYKGKNFYQLIAEYRIAYAIDFLKNEPDITIESLAYECGFNSKTSFNRYFKEIVGYTPSVYRQNFLAVSENA